LGDTDLSADVVKGHRESVSGQNSTLRRFWCKVSIVLFGGLIAAIFISFSHTTHSTVIKRVMDIQSDVIAILQSNLGVPVGAIMPHPDTPVLGAIPEMDSMSVIGILASLEEQYGITVDDDEISADVFATVGSLTTFVESKLR
jgi:acyl carrier protein